MTKDWLAHQAAPKDQAKLSEAYGLLEMWARWAMNDRPVKGYNVIHVWRPNPDPLPIISDRLAMDIDAAVRATGDISSSILKRAFLRHEWPADPRVFDRVLLEFWYEFYECRAVSD